MTTMDRGMEPTNNGLAKPPTAMIAVEQQRAIAETQAAMIIARQFPRNRAEVQDRIRNACASPALAEKAVYSYARGGTDISGPSIRLAEAIAQNWGNIQYGVRELSQRNGESEVEAFAWDVETNARSVKVFTVKHERHTRQGFTVLTDPRDIYEMVANNGSRRLRACLLAVIPADIQEMAVAECDRTLRSNIEITPEYLKKVLDVAESYGVTREMIEKRIQRRFDSITPAQVVQLRSIFNSLKDGMSTAGDWFDSGTAQAVEVVATKTQSVKDKLRAKTDQPSLAQEEPLDDPFKDEAGLNGPPTDLNMVEG